ncbi:glutathione S-transferase APIC-like [Bidens hawaiensis]|uniref:glutathione S-transferase APIC-like n=1 Tax=Bidens hawaiensis TaxID=980011 RepID=UPI0040491C9F
MAIKVYGSMFSAATLRVLLCLAEKDIDFELITVDLATGEHKKPHMLERNPFGQIPAFEDGDLKLFESRAIARYISVAYAGKGTDLISPDPKKAAVEDVWSEVEAHQFQPAIVKLGWELYMKRVLFGQKADEDIVNAEEKKLASVLDVYEERLSKTKYLGGDSFSLADLSHAPMTSFLLGTKTERVLHERPHVSAWVTDMFARPACVKVFGVPAY